MHLLCRRVQKHLAFDTGLLEEVYDECTSELLERHRQLDTILRQAYGEGITPAFEEVEAFCSKYRHGGS